jgi:threonine/homoserine/homoserine lactone efflux protein
MNAAIALVATLSLGFAFGFVGSMPLAGPVSVLVISRSVERRFHAAWLTGLGGAVVEGLYAGVAFWSFTTFLARITALRPWFDAIACVVLLYLGVKFARWVEPPASAKKRKEDDGKSFFLGASVTALNPTILVTWTAATTTLYSTDWVQFAPWMALPFGLGAALGIASWFGVLVTLTKRYQDALPRKALRWIVRGIGVALILMGAYLGSVAVRHFVSAAHASRDAHASPDAHAARDP